MTAGGKLALGVALGTSAGGALALSWMVCVWFAVAALAVLIEEGVITIVRKRK